MKKHILTIFFLFVATALVSQVNLQQGLKAYYPFNGNLKDSTGNGNDGNNKGATLVNDKDGNANSACFMDGNDQYVEVAAAPSIQPTNAISVAAWLNTTDSLYWNFAVCKRLNQAKEPGNSYLLGTTGDVPAGPTWQWSISSADTQYLLVTNKLVEQNKWLHLVGTFNGDTLKLHLNGFPIGSRIINHTTISYSSLTLKLGVGIPTSSGNKTAWKGYMDEVRIYDRELTSDEIKYLYDPALLSADKQPAEKVAVSLYPNPANGRILLTSAFAKDKLAGATVQISDASGRVVLSVANEEQGIDVSNLAQGIYYLRVADFNTTIRFVKQ